MCVAWDNAQLELNAIGNSVTTDSVLDPDRVTSSVAASASSALAASRRLQDRRRRGDGWALQLELTGIEVTLHGERNTVWQRLGVSLATSGCFLKFSGKVPQCKQVLLDC